MREPFESLLGDYHDHWLLAKHLTGNVPDFAGIFDDPRWRSLSGSEQKFMRIALAFYNGDREATIADLGALDRRHLARFITALLRSQVHTQSVWEEVNDAVAQLWREAEVQQPDVHDRALHALDKLQDETGAMVLPSARPGDRPYTVADTFEQLFLTGRASIDHHRRWVAAEKRAAEREARR